MHARKGTLCTCSFSLNDFLIVSLQEGFYFGREVPADDPEVGPGELQSEVMLVHPSPTGCWTNGGPPYDRGGEASLTGRLSWGSAVAGLATNAATHAGRCCRASGCVRLRGTCRAHVASS